jgi:hypothetical protein
MGNGYELLTEFDTMQAIKRAKQQHERARRPVGSRPSVAGERPHCANDQRRPPRRNVT